MLCLNKVIRALPQDKIREYPNNNYYKDGGAIRTTNNKTKKLYFNGQNFLIGIRINKMLIKRFSIDFSTILALYIVT